MNGCLNLLKPPGMSSGAAVAIVKRLTGEKVGHAGTLDPEAAGVLPIMIGRATRLLDYFTDKSKGYIAEIAFTGSTDTQDAQGVLTEEGAGIPDREAVERILPAFRGRILQRPPAYSAVKQGGKPLYALARKGVEVLAAVRETEIGELALLEPTDCGYMLHVECAGGTYIRTLCHDIGQALHCPAHMRFLLRTRHGGFLIENAVTVEEVKEAAEKGTLSDLLLPMDAPLLGLPRVDVPDRYRKIARNGGKLPAESAPDLRDKEHCRLYLQDELIGIGRRDGDVLRFQVGLVGGET